MGLRAMLLDEFLEFDEQGDLAARSIHTEQVGQGPLRFSPA